MRYADAFPVNSGTFSSYSPNPAGGYSYAPVPANTMIDLGASYRLPIAQNVTWSLNVSDLLDTRVATFAGVPQIGRLIATRVNTASKRDGGRQTTDGVGRQAAEGGLKTALRRFAVVTVVRRPMSHLPSAVRRLPSI